MSDVRKAGPEDGGGQQPRHSGSFQNLETSTHKGFSPELPEETEPCEPLGCSPVKPMDF